MTLALMKALAPIFSMTGLSAAIAAAAILSATFAWAGSVASSSAPLPDDIAGKPAKVRGFPTFCEIPPRPSNVRSGKAFKEAVVAIRLAGAHLEAQTAPGTFSLEDTDGFASAARAEATPPPPMSPPDLQQTEDFTKQARALAVPPGPR